MIIVVVLHVVVCLLNGDARTNQFNVLCYVSAYRWIPNYRRSGLGHDFLLSFFTSVSERGGRSTDQFDPIQSNVDLIH